MSKNDEYRANAVECERMAKVARNETDKQSWLGMARHWLAMIKVAPDNSAGLSRTD
jgi:hypothetical protein